MMMKWITKNYGVVIVITVLVLIILLGIYMKGRNDGSDGGFLCNWLDIGCPGNDAQDNGSANPGSANVPDAPGGSVVDSNGAVPAHIVAMANRLSQWLNQWGNAADRCSAYKDAMNMTDGDFISMSNYYKNSNNSTLLGDIMKTNTWCGTGWFGGYEKDWSEEIINRIHRLEIP